VHQFSGKYASPEGFLKEQSYGSFIDDAFHCAADHSPEGGGAAVTSGPGVALQINHSGGSNLIITEATPADAAAWDAYALTHPASNGCHSFRWRNVIKEAFRHDSYYLMAKDSDNNVQGILPLVFLSSRLFGRFLVSMPFLNYGGIISNTAQAQQALLNAAQDIRVITRASHIELRHMGPAPVGWPSKQHKVAMHLDLPSHFELLWKGFSSKLRSQIRRAQKEQMTVQIGGKDLVDGFYDVFSRNMRDLGTPVYSRGFFTAILQHFPDEAHLVIVSLGAKPVAAGLVYGFKDMLEIIWASSDRRYNRLSPNMLLYSSVLEYACARGYRKFDFGRSTPDSGTYRFKAQWGAKPVSLHWYYSVATAGTLPDLSPANSNFRLAISAWRRMPLVLTRWLGPHIIKHIP
jgi:FemAB-related protein (PEP-CTERM system-associated)